MHINTQNKNIVSSFQEKIQSINKRDTASLQKLDNELSVLFRTGEITPSQFCELEADIGRKYQ